MSNRYIFIEDSKPRSNDPDKNFETFVNSIKKAIISKVRERNAEGTLDLMQIYNKIGRPELREYFKRGNIYKAHAIVEVVKELVRSGVLHMTESSWDQDEKEKHPDGNPGLDDMCPIGYGYNNVGGPDYLITFENNTLTMIAGFCRQDLGDAWDEIRVTEVWMHRNFKFVPANDEEETRKKVLNVFGEWIIDKFAENVKQGLLQDVADLAANEWLEKFLTI